MNEREQLPPLVLPFWMGGEQASKLASAAHAWFSLLGRVAIWPAKQLDAMTCTPAVLDLLAWQRNVSRYAGEPDRLYRLRVAFAYANGKDAGGLNGWKRIFARLELGKVELEERVPGQDWDCINIVSDDASFPDKQNVLEIIINEYGRTCRRYRFVSRIPLPSKIHCALFDNDHVTVIATADPLVRRGCAVRYAIFHNDLSTLEAHI